MHNDYRSFCIVHALDDTTSFLSVFKELDPQSYLVITADDNSIESAIANLRALEPSSLIVFLGHGHSYGLYSPETNYFNKRIIINSKNGDVLFNTHDILMLSCNSGSFIIALNTYRSVIGFGNIISSIDEVAKEAESTGYFRKLGMEDIHFFNSAYIKATMNALRLLLAGQILFKTLPQWISYFINKEINNLLKSRNKANRLELARLLFEFRNEIVYRSR